MRSLKKISEHKSAISTASKEFEENLTAKSQTSLKYYSVRFTLFLKVKKQLSRDESGNRHLQVEGES
jgi:hypothetical protein